MNSLFIDNFIKLPIYALTFFLPLLALPFTVESYEFTKLFLLFFLVLLSILGWLGKFIFVKRAFIMYRSPMDFAVLALFAGALIATIFSQDVITSLLGFYGRFSGGFIELALWIIFYLIISNNFSYFEARRLFLILFASSFLLSIWFHLSWWGVLQFFSFIPFFNTIVTTPLSISPQALAVFESLSLLFLLLYWCLYGPKKWIGSLLYICYALGYMSVLIVVNFWASWWILILTLVPFLAWSLKVKVLPGPELNRLTLVTLTLLVSFIFIALPNLVAFDRPIEILLTNNASWMVVKNMFSSFNQFLITGTGPANFFSAYNLFRPHEFNATAGWAIRFDSASSHYANNIATMGLLGVGGFIAFLAIVIYFSLKLFKTSAEFRRESGFYAFGFLGVLISLAFYYQSLPLSLLFWLTLAPLSLLLTHLGSFRQFHYDFSVTPEANLFLTSLFFVGILIVGLLGFFGGKMYYADVLYKRGIIAVERDKKIAHFARAIELNPYRIEYRIALAQSALRKVNEEVQKAGPGNVSDLTPLSLLVAQAVGQAQEITRLAPNSVLAWENRAIIYRDTRRLTAGEASKFANEAFDRASLLEPLNPVFPLQKALLAIDENALDVAEKSLQKARELKPDLLDIALAQALLWEKQGKLDEAVSLLGEMSNIPGLQGQPLEDSLFHLGRIAFNNNQLDVSIQAFETLVKINPSHSNAHYALGIAYERNGQIVKAEAQYKKVLELNPGNAEVKARLDQLTF